MSPVGMQMRVVVSVLSCDLLSYLFIFKTIGRPTLCHAWIVLRVAYGGGSHEVAAGGDHSLALTERGEVYGWGDQSRGALGKAVPVTARFAEVRQTFLGPARVSEIGCGFAHTICLGSSGIAKIKTHFLCGSGMHEGDHIGRRVDSVSAVDAVWGRPLAGADCASLDPTLVDMWLVMNQMGAEHRLCRPCLSAPGGGHPCGACPS